AIGHAHRQPAEERSDARADRLLGEWLDRPRHDGAADAVDAFPAARAYPGVPDGGTAQGRTEGQASPDPEEEGVAAQSAEEGQEVAAAGQGPAAREGEAETGAQASPLKHLDDTARERPPDGGGHLGEALPRHVLQGRIRRWAGE